MSFTEKSIAPEGARPVKAIRVHRHGGPAVLSYEDVTINKPARGEVRVRNRAIGLNFVDTYFRTGAYTPPSLPFTPGNEGAGEVVAVGEGVTGFAPGDRVAYVMTLGAYAEESIVPAHFLVHLPGAIDFETGAAMMLKGLTAQSLLRRAFRVEARPYCSHPRSSWRRWPPTHAMGKALGRHGDRYGRLAGEGSAGP